MGPEKSLRLSPLDDPETEYMTFFAVTLLSDE